MSMQSSVSLAGFHAVKLIAVVEADQSLLDSGLIVPSLVKICQSLYRISIMLFWNINRELTPATSCTGKA